MLYYAVASLVIALVAALLGLGGIASGAAGIVFLVLAAVVFLLSAFSGHH